MSLLVEPLVYLTATGPNLWQFWWPILFFYGCCACAFVVILPLMYGLVRIGWRLDYALGIASAPPPLAAAELPAAVADLQRMTLRRGLVIAGVFDVFATSFALIYVLAYVTQYQASPLVVALYMAAGLLAAAGSTILWIVPIGLTPYLAERANLQHRARRTSSPL